MRLIRCDFAFPLADMADPRALRSMDGGALMDLGCYCVNAARLLGGEPGHVLGEQVLAPSGVDVDFCATLRLPGDVVAVLDASFTVPSHQRLELVGDEATLALDAPFRPDWGFTVTIVRGEHVEPVEIEGVNPYFLELDDFAAAARGEREPLLGREDALGQARTIAALYRSAESGAAVTLP
jgi:predicted dehydrogenase